MKQIPSNIKGRYDGHLKNKAIPKSTKKSDDITLPQSFQKYLPGEDGNVVLRFSFMSITTDDGEIPNISLFHESPDTFEVLVLN